MRNGSSIWNRTTATQLRRYTNSDSIVFDTLENLLETAIPYVKAKEVARANEIDAELTKAPELFKVIDLRPFNVEEFYKGVPDCIENLWGPMGFMAERTVKNTTRSQDPTQEPSKTVSFCFVLGEGQDFGERQAL